HRRRALPPCAQGFPDQSLKGFSKMRSSFLPTVLFLFSLPAAASAQVAEPGRLVFAARCAGCHGSDANGGELGPGIATRVPTRTDEELRTLFRQGLPAAGMP